MQDSWSYTFDWRRKEHAAVTEILVRERFGSGWRKTFGWFIVVVLALGTVLAALSAIWGDFGSTLSLSPLIILVGFLYFRFGAITGFIRGWQVERTDPNVHHPITHTFDETGLRISMKTAESHLRWDGLFKIRETNETFLFYYTKTVAYFLPKRAIVGEGEVESLRAWLREHLPPATEYELSPR